VFARPTAAFGPAVLTEVLPAPTPDLSALAAVTRAAEAATLALNAATASPTSAAEGELRDQTCRQTSMPPSRGNKRHQVAIIMFHFAGSNRRETADQPAVNA